MLWDRAGSPHKKREKRKRKTEQHKSPHTDAQPSSHQGPDLKSKSLLTGLYRGHWAGVKRMPPWQKSLLVGHWALSQLPKIDLHFPAGWEEMKKVQKYLLSFISFPDPSTRQSALRPDFLLSPNPWSGGYQLESLRPYWYTCANARCCSWCFSLCSRAPLDREETVFKCPDSW